MLLTPDWTRHRLLLLSPRKPKRLLVWLPGRLRALMTPVHQVKSDPRCGLNPWTKSQRRNGRQLHRLLKRLNASDCVVSAKYRTKWPR